MFKQIWLYDGTPILLEGIQKYQLEDGTVVDDVPKDIEKEVEIDGETIIEYQQAPYEVVTVFDYPKEYTELQPEDGLYQPIFFDGEKWIGTKKEVWEAANPPKENVDVGVNVEDVILMNEELLMETSGLSARISKLENKGDA
ncbi:tail fiber protein [Brochothrix phage BtpYZU03]|nr:tail fiber protein [Brochothrix phage BtpYZU03]